MTKLHTTPTPEQLDAVGREVCRRHGWDFRSICRPDYGKAGYYLIEGSQKIPNDVCGRSTLKETTIYLDTAAALWRWLNRSEAERAAQIDADAKWVDAHAAMVGA